MTPLELRRVLDEHSLQERNKDSCALLFGALIVLTGMALMACAKWAWKKYNEEKKRR